MTWVLLSFLTALFESSKDVLSKTRLRTADACRLAFAWRCLALPFLLPPLLVTGIPPLGSDFWWALLVSGGINAVTAIIYMQAIKASDLSLTVPIIALTPLFLLLTSPLLLGETPGAVGTTGVLLIVAGSYRLGAGGVESGALAPLRALWREPGPRLMLAVAILWSISGNIDKIGVQNSSPFFWAATLHAAIAAVLAPIACWRRRPADTAAVGVWKMLPVGMAGAAATVCQMLAISITLVPYVIAIKRTSTVMSALWGHLLLGEPGLRQRLPAALLMVAGAILVTLG